MKSYHEPIAVTVGDDGAPQSWCWRARVWRVLRVLDRWVLQSRWWTGHSERRDYLLVGASISGNPDAPPNPAAAGGTAAAAHGGNPDATPSPAAAGGTASAACAVELYLRRRVGEVEALQPQGQTASQVALPNRATTPDHGAWILARILS